MIAKGNLHAHGDKLAAYLVTGKTGERAELVELRGFAADNIRDAFADVQIQSEATRCEKPFFHCYIRLPEGEALEREQWQLVADRIEKQLGFQGQGRAIAFHHDKENGETHMHMAWSRIDLDEMRAIDPGLYKNKLKEVCRELEQELGLMPLGNERPEEQKTLSAARPEYEQARRLGTDLTAIREDIRECWDRSDNGKSFAVVLEEKGYMLARGDRRDFVVIDHAGGEHALSKRITGATAGETRDRLSDVDKAQLPAVGRAKEIQAERASSRMTVREEMQWEDRLAAAAIEKERQEPKLVPKETLRISEEAVKRDLAYHQQQAAQPMTAVEKKIADAIDLTYEGYLFAATLKQSGLVLARATAEDVKQLSIDRAKAFAADDNSAYLPRLREGQLVAITNYGDMRLINSHRIDVDTLGLIAASERSISDIASVRATSVAYEWRPNTYVSMTLLRAPELASRLDAGTSPDASISRLGTALTKTTANAIGGIVKFLSGEGKPNPERMTADQLAAHQADTERQARAAELAKPQMSELERQAAIELNKRLEEQLRRDIDRMERERDSDYRRGRERER